MTKLALAMGVGVDDGQAKTKPLFYGAAAVKSRIHPVELSNHYHFSTPCYAKKRKI